MTDKSKPTDETMNDLLAAGLSPAEAWYYYGVEIKGVSQSEWARQTGKDQSTVSKAMARAEKKLEQSDSLKGNEATQS